MPVAALGVAMAEALAIRATGPRTAAVAAHHHRDGLQQASLHHRCRMPVTVAVARLHHADRGLHRLQPDGGAGRAAAVMRHQQHIASQGLWFLVVTCHDGLFLRGFDVTREQHRAALCIFHPQHATDGVGFDGELERTQLQVGLNIMRERAAQIKAEVEINSQAGYGTVVKLLVPGAQKQNPNIDNPNVTAEKL